MNTVSNVGTWSPHFAWWPVTTIDGGRVGFGPVMRRHSASGGWEYRKANAAEEADYVSRDAW
jgi:hypothetical protein